MNFVFFCEKCKCLPARADLQEDTNLITVHLSFHPSLPIFELQFIPKKYLRKPHFDTLEKSSKIRQSKYEGNTYDLVYIKF